MIIQNNTVPQHIEMKHPAIANLYKVMARKSISIISLFSTAIITIIIMRIEAELAGFGGKGLFYLQVAFTKNNFIEILSSWRSGGVDLLLGTLWVQYVYAVSYAVLFASVPAYYSAAGKNGFREQALMPGLVFIIPPFIAALLDWIGNTLLYLLFSGKGRFLSEEMITAISVIASAKWALIAICLMQVLRSYFKFRKEMKSSSR